MNRLGKRQQQQQQIQMAHVVVCLLFFLPDPLQSKDKLNIAAWEHDHISPNKQPTDHPTYGK